MSEATTLLLRDRGTGSLSNDDDDDEVASSETGGEMAMEAVPGPGAGMEPYKDHSAEAGQAGNPLDTEARELSHDRGRGRTGDRRTAPQEPPPPAPPRPSGCSGGSRLSWQQCGWQPR